MKLNKGGKVKRTNRPPKYVSYNKFRRSRYVLIFFKNYGDYHSILLVRTAY